VANLKSIPHRCHPILVAFVWELTEETIDLPLGCLQGGGVRASSVISRRRQDSDSGIPPPLWNSAQEQGKARARI